MGSTLGEIGLCKQESVISLSLEITPFYYEGFSINILLGRIDAPFLFRTAPIGFSYVCNDLVAFLPEG